MCVGGCGVHAVTVMCLCVWVCLCVSVICGYKGALLTSSQQGPFIATYLTVFGGISWSLCPAVLGRLFPRSNEDSIDRPLNVLSLDQGWQSNDSAFQYAV